jgi:hypothetical protein
MATNKNQGATKNKTGAKEAAAKNTVAKSGKTKAAAKKPDAKKPAKTTPKAEDALAEKVIEASAFDMDVEIEEPSEMLRAGGNATNTLARAAHDTISDKDITDSTSATLPSGVPTGMESAFFGDPEYEWPEKAKPGKAPGLKQLVARIRFEVSAWRAERVSSKGRRPWIAIGIAAVVVVGAACAVYGIGALVAGDNPTSDTTTNSPASVELPLQREKNASIPNLTALPGLSVDDALALLGKGWELEKGVAGTDGLASTGGGAASSKTVRIVYAPSTSVEVDGAQITALLTDNNQIAAVTFTCPMDVLGYPDRDFSDTISDRELLITVLGTAGLSPQMAELAAPSQADTAVYRVPGDPQSGLLQETWTFTGRGSGAREDTWLLTVTYNYGTDDGTSGGTDSGTDNSPSGGTDNSTGSSAPAPLRIMEISVY